VTLAAGIADTLGAAAVILCIPLAILVIGIPFALGVRALLWLAGML
jgi:hypothetical protein